jgi:sortase A
MAAAVLVLIAAVPAAANTVQPGWEPGPSRQSSTDRSQEAGWDIGYLTIPAIGVSETVRAGVSLKVLDRGVGQWAGTAQPGEDGNVVLAGHRTTFSRPFYDLDLLRDGDLISMTNGQGIEIMYSVSETMIVEPSDIWITFDRPNPTLTLFACHPKGSETQRIVVIADLVSTQPLL